MGKGRNRQIDWMRFYQAQEDQSKNKRKKIGKKKNIRVERIRVPERRENTHLEREGEKVKRNK